VNGKQAVVAVSGGKDAVVELALAEGASADAAARAFLGQEGITSGSASNATVHGLPAVGAEFAAATESGELAGSVLFVEHGRAVFRLLGYAPRERWPSNKAAAEHALASFQALTDPRALAVQPQRLDIVVLDGRTTIEALTRSRATPVSADVLTLLNHVERSTPLESGRLIKWVAGQPLP
jgi:predicted Zn-dependent protease